MTDETQTDPMATAVANGFKEAALPSNEDRAKAVITALEHAVKHNAPVALETIKELRYLLGVAEEVVEKVEAAADENPAS